jgi:hypothetical protein
MGKEKTRGYLKQNGARAHNIIDVLNKVFYNS